MKKFLYILALLFTLPLIGFTQNDTLIINNNYRFKIGVKGLYEKSIGGIEPNYVFNYGVQIIYKIGKKWSSIESGIYFYKRTQSITFKTGMYTHGMYNYELNQLHIPIKYRWKKRLFYWTLGFYGEYMMSRNIEQPTNTTNSLGLPDDKNFHIGFISSIGIEKKMILKGVYIFTEIGGSVNFTSLQKSEEIIAGSSLFARNYGVALGLNYKF